MPATVLGLDADPDDTNPNMPDFGAFALPADHFGPALSSDGNARFTINASPGLKLRGGPAVSFEVLSVLPSGSPVTVIGRDGDWAQVDTSGDGTPDGYVFSTFLKPA